MQAPANPPDERERLQALKSLGVLDTKCEERFDRYTRLARRLFDVPIALVSLVDDKRQWFKSRQGLDATETPRDISFCGHAILETKVFVVEDASDDERFFDNPLVVDDPSIRFYAGFPLTGSGGHQLGTLCIIDREPREFGPEDRQALTDMGAMVASELSAIELATMDELTQTSNRRGFDALARQALAACDRAEQPASVVLIDMNGFKGINDTYGHEEGDRALIEFASLMRRTFRESDIVARIGGDEFAAPRTRTSPCSGCAPPSRSATSGPDTTTTSRSAPASRAPKTAARAASTRSCAKPTSACTPRSASRRTRPEPDERQLDASTPAPS